MDAKRHRLDEVDLALVDRLVVPASLHDTEGRFVYMNEAAERASGLSNRQMLGRSFTDPLLPEERKKVSTLFRAAVERGEPTDFETLFVDANGHIRGVRAQHLPLRVDDAIVGVLILAFAAPTPPKAVGFEPQPRLTRRQREVLDLIAEGMSTAEIATKLTLSTETVKNHLRSVFRELNVHTRLQAIAAARRIGLLAPPVLAPESASQDGRVE